MMGKRLAPVLAILAMWVPAAASALGLGNITMNSALNQPLDADIELLSVQSGDLANLVVRLGSDEDFNRVGAERAFFLTKINFEVIRRKNNTAYVHLSTTPVVTEPFLDFVVEARWPRGRILREFTVLVDPPVLTKEAPAPVQQAAVAAQPAPAAVAPAPAQSTSRQAPIRARAELAPVAHGAGELTYGPVQRNDTLYEIANRMRPSGVTVNQMMLALVRNNPNAFYNGNVNQLKAGYVLRVENAASLQELSVAQADAEVERQRSEWQARKSGKLVRQAEAPAGGQVARGGEAAPAAGSAAEQARLKLVAPGSKGAGSGAGEENVDQLRQDLLLAAEALDANRQETEELKSRLAEMEEQLAAMQRLITLKDDEMLAMQKQMGGAAKPEGQAAEPAVPEAVEKEAAAKTEMPEAGAEAEKMTEAPAPAAEEAAKPALKPAPKPKAAEPGLLDDPMVLYGGIGILVLIVAAVVIQRRRRLQGGFEESILNVGGEGGNVGATAETMAQGGESSMVSDFAMSEMSGMSGIEADSAEVDPVSEADVYLAYGRHQQAEEILKEALEKEPQRHEIKLKLLEVYFAAKDREAFEQHAQELHDSLGDESDPLWAKAVTMGSQLCPGSELFGGTSTETMKESLEEGAGEADEDLLDFDFDIDSEGAAPGDEGKEGDVFAELEAATSGEAAVAEEEAPTEEVDMSLDFDMDMGEESAEVTAEAPVQEEESKAADNSLDFDVSSLDFSLDEGGAEEAEAVVAETEDTGLDFDLEGLGATDEATAEIEAEAPTEEFTAESEAALAESGEDLDLGEELDESFGDVDEVGTKLDLAKAYVDMGDSDGARSILDEVIEEGDADQKKQAEELLAQLA
jgi:pilus assembly protein FimV